MDYDHLDCITTLLSSYTDRVPPPCPPLQIVFKLSCNFSISRWTLPSQSSFEAMVVEDRHPLMSTSVTMSLQDLFDHEKAYAIINQSIINWPVGGADQKDFINLTLGYGRNAVKSTVATHNYVYVHMLMTACLYQVIHETPDVSGMIPADDSSIESLETVVVESGSCSVCLEEFSQGCEGVSMPCQHVFHPDCIKKWLRVSHFCPCCRFQMPKK